MRRAFLLLMVSILAGAALALPTSTQRTWTHTSPSKRCTYKYVYPELKGYPVVNKLLASAYRPTAAHMKEMDVLTAEVKGKYDEEMTGTVTLLTDKLVSVNYQGLGVLTLSAHPTKLIGARTVDLKTSRVLKLKDLLKPGAASLALLRKEATRVLKPILEQDSFPEVNSRSDFEFYLTKDKLVLINIFDVHAIQSVEAEIPVGRLKPVLAVQWW